MSKMRDVIALANTLANERHGNQHPVSTLSIRAKAEGIHGIDFGEALAAAVDQGFLIVSPDCGPNQLGVFQVAKR